MVKKSLIAIAGLLAALLLGATAANYLAPVPTAKLLRDLSRQAAGLTPATVQVGDLAVPYLEGGQGEPLLMVHGFTANKDTFNDAARVLTQHYRVISVDLPGFGEATRDPKRDYGMAAQAEFLRAFIQAKGLKKPHIAGSSMGGGIVAALALQHPEEVASVWLLDAAATQDMTTSPLIQKFRAKGEFPLLTSTLEEQRVKFSMLFTKVPFMPHSVEVALNEAAARDREHYKRILTTLLSTKTVEQYPPVNVPAFIVFGENDQIVPPASAEALGRTFVHHEVRIMPGIGHVPMMEAPRQTAQDYLDFRARLGS